jgi:hypothetical protein
MGWFHSFVHAVAKVIGIGAAAAAMATGGPPGAVATGSVSAGMQAGPACVTRTLQPGQSASVAVSVVNPTRGKHGGYERLDMGVENLPDLDTPQYSTPRSWISFTVPGTRGWVAAHSSATSTFTVHVPLGAERGRYGFMSTVTAYGRTSGTAREGTPPGHNVHVSTTFGSAATTTFEFSVGVPPPRRAFCEGSGTVSYWAPDPQAPICHGDQAPGRLGTCRAGPPAAPPVASAKNCHWSRARWQQLAEQERLARKRYGPRYGGTGMHCEIGPGGPFGSYAGTELGNERYYRFEQRIGTLRRTGAPARFS